MILYENFNTSNQTQPRFEAHENFVADIKVPGCSLVSTLPDNEQCAYVQNEEFCEPEFQLINYLEIFYCSLAVHGSIIDILGVVLLSLLLSFQFLILGHIADKYFCPSLTMISKVLGLSEALAGVTLLAFGNGAPDLFTALASMDDSTEVGLQFGELFGAAAFVSAVVGGSIIIVTPFQVFASTCCRDYLFLIFSVFYIDVILVTNNIVELGESFGVLIIYVIYILVVCIDQYLLTRSTRDLEKYKTKTEGISFENVSKINYERESTILYLSKRSSAIAPPPDANIGVMAQFFKSINPIDWENWHKSGYCGKACTIVQLPLAVLLFIIPIADYDAELDGWTKLLNCFHIFSAVPICYFCLFEELLPLLSLPVLGIFIAVAIPVAIFVYMNSKTNRVPKFHFIYAIIGAVTSIAIISFVANEIIVILMVLGIVLNANSSFLGCTLLAWGNSVGDLITNITLAKQGYHKMGFAACIGGPLFNILMSLGITFIYKSYKNPGRNTLNSGALGITCSVFLLIILFYTLFAFVITEFQARRSIGYLLIVLYVLCFTFIMASTLNYIHPYGTDHTQDAGF